MLKSDMLKPATEQGRKRSSKKRKAGDDDRKISKSGGKLKKAKTS